MTICIATSNFSPQTGGIAAFYGHLTDILVMHGHKVVVLIPGYTAEKESDDHVLEEGNKIVVTLRKNFSRYSKYYAAYFPKGGLFAAGWIASGLAMKDWLLENHTTYKIDIIEASDYGGLGIFLINDVLPPVVITGHGTFTQLSKYNPVKEDSQTKLVRRLEALSLQKANAIIAHSRFNQDELNTLTGRPVSFATAPWKDDPVTVTTNDEGFLFAAGGLQMVKGAVVMTEAIDQCIKKPFPIRAYWAGGDTYTAPGGNLMSTYLEEQYPAIWNKHFTWLNELSPQMVREKMASASIVVIPSLFETFNYVALEAASLGKPLIITTNTGAASYFTHGVDAWIIPADDATALADAIIYLNNDSSLCEKLGQQAAAMIKKAFDEKQAAAERTDMYTKTITDHKITVGKDELLFLKKYTTLQRKWYFAFKNTVKKIIGRS